MKFDVKSGLWVERDPFCSVGVAIAVGAVASIGSAAISSSAASSAAKAQANAATNAAALQAGAANTASADQLAMFNSIQQMLSPFVQQGTGAVNELGMTPQGVPGATGGLTDANGQPTGFIQQGANIANATAANPAFNTSADVANPNGPLNINNLAQTFNPTMAQLEQTPGYQFTLDQGLKATQNSYAAQGLGTSGAAMKGADQYATGLASTTYNQQLQNYLTQNAQQYNMLLSGQSQGANLASAQNTILQGGNTGAFNMSQANQQLTLSQLLSTGQLGENAAAQTGAQGVASQTAANQLLVGGAGAQASGIVGAAGASAAGQIGSANALGAGLSGVGGSISSGLLLQQLLGGQNVGTTAAANNFAAGQAAAGSFGPFPASQGSLNNFN